MWWGRLLIYTRKVFSSRFETKMIDSMIDRAVDEELKTASWSDFVVDYGVFEFSWSDSIDGIRFRNYRSIIEKKFGKWIIRAFSSLFYSTNKVRGISSNFFIVGII